MNSLDAAGSLCQLLRSGAGDALPEGDAVWPDELDRRAGIEPALAALDADSEQARAGLDERAAGSLVHVQPPRDRLAEPKPELERRLAVLVRREPGPGSLAGEDRAQHLLAVARCDHRRDAGGARHLGREHLASHASATELGGDAELRLAGQRALAQ